jgi:hypothetical protein
VTRLRVGRSEPLFLVEERDSFLHKKVQAGSGDHLPSYSVGTGVLCSGVRWPGRAANYSFASSVVLRMSEDLCPLFLYVFMALPGTASSVML